MIKVLVVGCGNMGASHARAYSVMPEAAIVGLVSRGDSKQKLAAHLKLDIPLFEDLETALRIAKPDAVCISTYPDSHESLAMAALEAGCHVFVEKPLSTTTAGARRLIAAATVSGRKLVVGYLLRHHPTWQQFIDIARTLGRPLVMRMNLNQQSSGEAWRVHQNLLQSVSPIVDCGVHYVDVMCQMVRRKPLRVSAIGASLDERLPPGRCNYGQLQVTFDDGSVGWYEAGWGPMMSETAFFVKDAIGPRGAVSLRQNAEDSSLVEDHVKVDSIRIHSSALNSSGAFAFSDQWLSPSGEIDHDTLCRYEQEFFFRAIREDFDLSEHLSDGLVSLAIVLAAEQSIATNRTVDLTDLDVSSHSYASGKVNNLQQTGHER